MKILLSANMLGGPGNREKKIILTKPNPPNKNRKSLNSQKKNRIDERYSIHGKMSQGEGWKVIKHPDSVSTGGAIF
jgi:hypothetical protein